MRMLIRFAVGRLLAFSHGEGGDGVFASLKQNVPSEVK